MSFVFNTPAPTNNAFGGGFGTSQPAASTAFGQPATAAPATTGFGAQPQQSAFGAATTSNAPATSGFGGFGSAAPGFGGFGSAASTAPTSGFGGGFGTTATTQAPPTATGFGGFGTAAATQAPATGFGGGFGTTATTQAQPAATGFGGFGTTAATQAPATGFGGGFGTNTTSQAPATGFGGGFGTNTTSQAPATSNAFGGFGATTSTSLFGAPAGTSTGFGGFGANKLSTTTTGGGLFGNNPATTTSFFGSNNATGGTGGFGLQQQQQQQQQSNLTTQREQQVYQLLSLIDQETRAQAKPAINSEDYKPENVWHALALLKSWWDPKSPSCRFRHYFYNVVLPQEAHLYQKPADHDQAAWDAAQAANPDRTTRVPALAIGFDDVQKRMDEQHKLSEAHGAKLVEIQTMIKDIQKKSQLETAVKLDEYKRKHMQATQRVIKFLKYAQVLRNKGLSITPDEEVMRARLENIQDQLQRSEQFHGKLSQLWAQLQLIKEQGRQYAKIDGVDGWEAVSEENMSGITKILDEQNNGVQHIIEVLETDTTEVNNLCKGWRALQ